MKLSSKAWLSVLLSAATVLSASFPAVAAGETVPAEPAPEPAAPAVSAPPVLSEPAAIQPEKNAREQVLSGEISPEEIRVVSQPGETPSAEPDKTEETEEAEEEIRIPGELTRDLYPDRYDAESLSTPEPLPGGMQVLHSAEEYRALKNEGMVQKAQAETETLPTSVDNSQKKYFPVVGDQKAIGSCACFGNVYYLMTYEYHHTHDLTCTPESIMSPKFIYNIINGGNSQAGSNDTSIHPLIQTWGVPTMSVVPYDEDWCSLSPTKEVYRDAANHRVKNYYRLDVPGTTQNTVVTFPNDPDLTLLKSVLARGEVVSYSSPIFG